MTLSISISKESEGKLRDRAAAAGKPVDKLASELLEEAICRPAATSVGKIDGAEGPSIFQRLSPTLDQIWKIKPALHRVEPKGDEAQVRQIILEKYRKQGLHL